MDVGSTIRFPDGYRVSRGFKERKTMQQIIDAWNSKLQVTRGVLRDALLKIGRWGVAYSLREIFA